MKRIAVFITAFTCLVGAAEFGHAGTAPANLTVSATIPGSCSIATTPVAFGSLPSVGSAFADGAVSVNCAVGQAYTVTLSGGGAPSQGFRWMTAGGLVGASYALYKDLALTQIWGDSGFAGTFPTGTGVAGVGTGAAQAITIHGAGGIKAGGAPPGNYTDTVVATVNF